MNSELQQRAAAVADWNPQAAPVIYALLAAIVQAEQREAALRDELSTLSSWLGQGLGDEATSAHEFGQRIRAGVDSHIAVQSRVEVQEATHALRARAEAAEAKVAQAEQEKAEAVDALESLAWPTDIPQVDGKPDLPAHYRSMAARITQSRDELKHGNRKLLARAEAAEAQLVQAEQEKAAQQSLIDGLKRGGQATIDAYSQQLTVKQEALAEALGNLVFTERQLTSHQATIRQVVEEMMRATPSQVERNDSGAVVGTNLVVSAHFVRQWADTLQPLTGETQETKG